MKSVPPIHQRTKRKISPPRDPKPCPTCYNAMRPAENPTGWECPKHGEPTRP